MKKITSLVLVLSMLAVLLSSCTGKGGISVNGEKIDNEIYMYFKDLAEKSGEENTKTVQERVVRYVAINSEFHNRGLSLSKPQKAAVSTEVNDLWHLYGAYYESIGVSKQAIYKIVSSQQYEKCLLAEYYGANGTSPVSEEEIKAFFEENYAAIRFVTGYLFNSDENGVAVEMTEEQKTNTVNSFNSVASMVNSGTAIEEAVGSLGENTEVHDTVVYSFSDESLPTGFFSEVKKIEVGKAAAVQLSNYVFLVLRVDVFSEEYGYFETYRSECLEKMKGEEFKTVVDNWAKNYTAEQ